jgi:hypothetical protein
MPSGYTGDTAALELIEGWIDIRAGMHGFIRGAASQI